MTRRTLLTAAAALAPISAAKIGPTKWDRSRLSAVTDEIATTPAGALNFAKLYDLKWLELRAIPGGGGEYAQWNEASLKQAAKEFADAGVGISFLNTGMCKFWLPGSQYRAGRLSAAEVETRKQRDTKRFEDRMKYLESSIRAAHILNVKDIRVFAFSRTDEPESNFNKISEVLGELALRAEKEGVRLLLENETSCNAATCAETVKLLKMTPSKALGMNWDVMNGEDLKEKAFPLGYKMIPREKLWNIQVKGWSLQTGHEKFIDYATILAALQKDGYQGKVGLETHMFGRMLLTHSHYCIREMIRLVEHPSA